MHASCWWTQRRCCGGCISTAWRSDRACHAPRRVAAAFDEEESGFYAFNDVHATMAFCLANDLDQAGKLVRRLDVVARDARGSNRAMTANVGLPFAQAMVAFARGDYASVIEHALPVRDHAHTFGGSHAQRDVITLTLIEAALRSGRKQLARHLIAERTVHKPASGWGWRLLARAV